MLSNDFYGKNSFVWWTGIVEDRDDPLQLGSVRVRIIGLHSDDRSLVPTESLPWAQVLQPATGAATNSGPREADWVFGFFQDGDYAQIPVVVGVFPGIESVQSQTIYNQIVVKKGAAKTPIPSQVDRVVGEPTTYRMARGNLQGTLTERLNKNLTHACDVKTGIEGSAAWARLQNGQLIKTVVGTIKGLAASLGMDGSGLISIATNKLKMIQTYLRWIQSILKEVQDWSNTIIKYARIAKAVLDYINKIPDRLRQFLRECLAKVVSGISSIINSIFSTEGTDFGFGDLAKEFNNTVTELGKTTTEVIKTASIPGQFIQTLVNPSSVQDQSEAQKILDGVVTSISSNGKAINNQTQFKKTTNIP